MLNTQFARSYALGLVVLAERLADRADVNRVERLRLFHEASAARHQLRAGDNAINEGDHEWLAWVYYRDAAAIARALIG